MLFLQPQIQSSGKKRLTEVIPKSGLVYSERGNLTEVMCKPKIMPIKSITLQKLEEMEKLAKEMAAAAPQNEGNVRE